MWGLLHADEEDRRRLREAEARLMRAQPYVMAVLIPVIITGLLAHGWRSFGLFLQPVVFGFCLEVGMPRSQRPERWMAGALLISQLLYGAVIAFTGGPASPYLPFVTVSVLALAPRFRPPVLVAGTVVTVAIVLASTVAVDPSGFLREPLLVGTTIGVIVLVAAFAAAIVNAEIEQRAEAVLDPLTGLLNRTSLAERALELEAQAARTGHPVTVIAIDLDHFKAINDELGHEHGDAVLEGVAQALRDQLRAGDLVYRLGGDELLVILAGEQAAVGVPTAERLQAAIAHVRPAGRAVSASFGVATAMGQAARVDELQRRADLALYEAKRAGGDRVAVAAEIDTSVTLVAA